MTKIIRIDKGLYEVNGTNKEYWYLSRNPDWRNLIKQENEINKMFIDGYSRVFRNGS